jgi:hypothetical protein
MLVWLHINKQTQAIAQTYLLQKNIKIKNGLLQKKQTLLNTLQTLQCPHHIKQVARQQLNMKPIKLRNIKRFDYDASA